MFNIRVTAKLLRRLKCYPGLAVQATTRLGDWYGNLFSVGRKRFAMFTSERSLLTVVMPLKEIETLPLSLTDRVRWLLGELNVPPRLIDDELARMQACVITTTANRSVLGSLNDFTFEAKLYLGESPSLSLNELHHRLAGTPLKPLDYLSPCQATLDVLSRDNASP